MRIPLLALTAAACGSVEGNTPDAKLADASTVDTAPDARVPTCFGAPFTTSSPVTALNSTADDMYLRLSADELTAYFSRGGASSGAQPMISTRASVTSPFSAPTALVITGNNNAEVLSPTVTADGLTMYFTSQRTGTSGAYDVWRATRGTTTADFGSIANMSTVNSTADEPDVYVLPSGNAIYFSTQRNAQVYTVFRAEKSGTSLGAPAEVLNYGTGTFTTRVVVAPDELTMFYQAGNDIHETRRASTTLDFAPGTKIDVLNSVNADQPTWISADGCRLYFQTNRTGTGGFDFHVAVRTPQ